MDEIMFIFRKWNQIDYSVMTNAITFTDDSYFFFFFYLYL